MLQVIHREFDLGDDLDTQQWLASSVLLRMMFHQGIIDIITKTIKVTALFNRQCDPNP